MEDLLRDVTMDMLSGVGREIAETIGMEAALKLFGKFSGEAVYIPKIDTIEARAVARQVQKEFNGENTKELARRFGVGVRLVQRIVSKPFGQLKTDDNRRENP